MEPTAMEPTAPSGRQLELTHGDAAVTITEVGGGLRAFTVGGVDVLDGYGVGEMASRGRGQLLLPWPNRIAGGRYVFAGIPYQLPINEVDLGNASHGLTRWGAWELDAHSASSARARHILRAQSGYPFTVAFSVDYRLDDDGLSVTMNATNLSDVPAPVGMGAHPYFLLVGADGAHVRADDVRLTVPGGRMLPTDEANIPVGEVDVDGGPFDFRAGRPVGDLVIDTCFTGLARGADGRTRVGMSVPGGATVTVWADEAWPYVQVFTGDTLGGSERRRSIAVEPLTCPANAFNTGAGLRVLSPGESFGGSWGVQARLPARAA